MKIKWQNNDKKVELEVDLSELQGWLCIDVVEGESEEEFQKRIQEEIDREYNRPDYNNWHKHNRHIGYSKVLSEDGEDSFGHFKEPLIEEIRDKSIFFKDEIEREQKESYEICCEFIRKNVKNSDLAELFIKVVFDEYSIRELAKLQNPRTNEISDYDYNKLIIKEENNLSHKLRRLKRNLEKIILKTSDFKIFRGYLLEYISSKKL